MEFIAARLLDVSKPRRCIDDRPSSSPNSPQGAQEPGGSLNSLLLKAVKGQLRFNAGYVGDNIQYMRLKGVIPGVHRGTHQDIENNISDCGAADNVVGILQTIQKKSPQLLKTLSGLWQTQGWDLKNLDSAMKYFLAYSEDYIDPAIVGEEFIRTAVSAGASVEEVEGDHNPQVAWINTKPDTTLDTRRYTRKGTKAFNMDLQAVVEDANALGVKDIGIAMAAGVIVYLAAEKVLVEDKGHPALPFIVR